MLTREEQHKAILTILHQNTEVDLDNWESNCLASVLLDKGVTYDPLPEPEPTAVGSIVADDAGDVWVKVGFSTDQPWLIISDLSGQRNRWDQIQARPGLALFTVSQ